MTANLVTGLSPLQDIKSGMAANLSPASGADFSDVLKNSTDKGNNVNVPQPKEPADRNRAGEAKKADDNDPKADPKAEEGVGKGTSDKPVKAEDKSVKPAEDDKVLSDEAMEEIAATVNTMVQTIAEVLEIPVTQVEEAMNDLDMIGMEVLNPNMIPDLAVDLTQAADVTEIMTNEELFADVKQLMTEAQDLMQELADDLQIPVEELKSQIGDKAAEIKSYENAEDILAAKPADKDDKVITVREETDIQVKADDTEEIAPVSARHEDNKRQGTGSDSRQNNEHLSFTQTVTDTLKGMVAEKIGEPAVTTYTTTTDQIMEQVSESLRMTMKEDITEMEMQLHPASLGNVRVQVAAKDGVITASFTTENQQVKEVLEAQIIQLKDQMNEQGIKIEAVEVTVSSHAFERNLSENGENRGGQPEAEAKRKKVRGINLSGGDLNELDLEELDEEDKVTADMMARQGNTVDYMA